MLKNIGVFYNPKKKEVKKFLNEVKKWADKNKIKTIIFDEIPVSIPKIDIAVVFGGDGTILRIGRYLAGSKISIVGVNVGHMGFLAEVNRNEVFEELDNLKKKKKKNIQKRALLDIIIKRNNTVLRTYKALNDVAIKNGDTSRVIDLDVNVGREYIATYTGDGVIISTPTGSTAYSLAAGGPIIYPTLPLMLISAICPHTLTLRPLIVGEDKVININNLKKGQDIVISIDGQITQRLFPGDEISIKRSDDEIYLIITEKRNYFEVLREKLNWGTR